MKSSDFTAAMESALWGKRFEPVKRRAKGIGEHHVGHRFPIKGGISGTDVVALNLTATNPLLERLKSR